jgi:carbon starvation protein
MKQLTAYWYHFVIMFEALFILTLLETGTRVARFIFEETLSQFRGAPEETPGENAAIHHPNWVRNVTTSVLVCFLWGFLLYTGSISSLWRMMGIANQLLATIALAVGTSYLLKCAPRRIYALCTAIPLVFVVATVFAAGVESILMWMEELAQPATSTATAFSLKMMCVLAGVMLALTLLILIDAARRWHMLLRDGSPQPLAAPAGQ